MTYKFEVCTKVQSTTVPSIYNIVLLHNQKRVVRPHKHISVRRLCSLCSIRHMQNQEFSNRELLSAFVVHECFGFTKERYLKTTEHFFHVTKREHNELRLTRSRSRSSFACFMAITKPFLSQLLALFLFGFYSPSHQHSAVRKTNCVMVHHVMFWSQWTSLWHGVNKSLESSSSKLIR